MPDTRGSAATLRLKCSRDALVSNWRVLDEMSGSAATGAAIKADGYGLGAAEVLQALYAAGCRDFYVAHWQEAEPLLPLLQDAKLSVLHGVMPPDLDNPALRHPNVKPVLNSLAQVQRWLDAGGGQCDLMIDTGINRLGISPTELAADVIRDLDIDVCMSHLASADEDSDQNSAQLASFCDVKDKVRAQRYSLANSAGIALGETYAFDLTRPGLSLYGGVPRRELADTIRQVAFPETMILQTRAISAGDKVGYNAKFTADCDMRIATCSLGYADGYMRAFAGHGKLLAGDSALPVLGRISMDLICVDISDMPELREGDWLSCDYDLQAYSERTGLSQYELLTNLGGRYDRLWN